MQSEKKFTKYLKAKDDPHQLRRGLNNLIKQGLGNDYKSVTYFAEALIILNINTVPSKETLIRILEREQESINADIGDELISALCRWLRFKPVSKSKVELKTPQTKPRSAVRMFVQQHGSDSDGQSDSEQDTHFKNMVQQMIEKKKKTSTKHRVESDDHVLKKLVSQGNKLKDEHLNHLFIVMVRKSERK